MLVREARQQTTAPGPDSLGQDGSSAVYAQPQPRPRTHMDSLGGTAAPPSYATATAEGLHMCGHCRQPGPQQLCPQCWSWHR